MEATSFVVMDDTVGALAIESAGGRVDFTSLWESSATDSADVVDVVELPIAFEEGALPDKALMSKGAGGKVDFAS